MLNQMVLWTFIHLFFNVLVICIACYAFSRRKVKGALELSLFLLSVGIYGLAYMLELNGQSMENLIPYKKFIFFSAGFTAPTFLLFALRYTSKKRLYFWVYALILAIPLISGLMGLSFQNNDLVFQNYWFDSSGIAPHIDLEKGVIAKAIWFYLVGLSLVGEVLFFLKFIRSKGAVKMQALLVLLGSLIPTANAIALPHLSLADLDTQPLALMITALFISFAMLRYRMLDLVMIAREDAVDSIGECLIVLDEKQNILDINKACSHCALFAAFRIGEPIPHNSDFGIFLKRMLDRMSKKQTTLTEHYHYENKHYQVESSPISAKGVSPNRGYTVILHDITGKVEEMEEWKVQASTDPVTGINNRREWLRLAEKEMEEARKGHSIVTLIILELDHLKALNDKFGNLLGDQVLRAVSKEILGTLKPGQLLGHQGGGEFCILSSQMDGEAGWKQAEEIRRRIATMEFYPQGQVLSVNISCGIYGDRCNDDNDLELFLHFADLALHRAKSQGRNCSVLY